MKQFLLNAVNSWVTSLTGTVLGMPELWAGIGPLLDNDPATDPNWSMAIKGAGIVFVGLMMRDWTKTVVKAKR